MEKARVSTFAGVRFYSRNLDPLYITQQLRLPADSTHRVGEPRLFRTKSGKVIEHGVYSEGMWQISSKAWVNSSKLSTHIDWLLVELEPKAEYIIELMTQGVKGDIFCYSYGSDEPPSIPNSIRQRAEKLGLQIDIDHYSAETVSAHN